MSDLFENKFSLKRITDSNDKDYSTAISIYLDTTPPDIKTNSNEIVYWIEKKDTTNQFELLVFALYFNDSIIGFAMVCYIPKYKTMIYDYIALKNEYRINAVFFVYMNLIQAYVSSNEYDISYYIVEISNKNNGLSIDRESKFFKKLICLEGFGVINAKYMTLPLGLESYESSFEAQIYIKSNDNLNKIAKNTFLDIVQAIYYEYYLPWYTPFIVAELESYKKEIDKCYQHIEKQTSQEITFDINYPECPIMNSSPITEKTYGYLPSKKKKNYNWFPVVLLTVIIFPIVLISIYYWILTLIRIPISSVNSLVGAAFSATLSAFTAWFVAKKKL